VKRTDRAIAVSSGVRPRSTRAIRHESIELLTGATDAISAFRQPTKSRHALLWLGTGIRVFILFLIGRSGSRMGLVGGVGGHNGTRRPCSNREVAGDDPFLCKRMKKPDVSVNKP
jgi:hypothetical protein